MPLEGRERFCEAGFIWTESYYDHDRFQHGLWTDSCTAAARGPPFREIFRSAVRMASARRVARHPVWNERQAIAGYRDEPQRDRICDPLWLRRSARRQV